MKSELRRFFLQQVPIHKHNLSESLTLANSFGFLRKSGRGLAWQKKKLKKVCGIFFDIAVVVVVEK